MEKPVRFNFQLLFFCRDMYDFKTYIFPLLFFKRISDVCDEKLAVAILWWDRDDPSEDFQYRIKVDLWALPVLEAVYTPAAH